jgi:transcriptional regulator with XRE-family HTH domain
MSEARRTRLRDLRLSRGLSPERVAADMGISFVTYRAWEYGLRAPSRRNVFRLAEYFGVSPEEINAAFESSA